MIVNYNAHMKDNTHFKEISLLDRLFRIAEVARFLGVSTTTLRYYEEYGLLKPAKIDEMTGYRSYDIRNIGEITHIIDLRRSGLSMLQIKEYYVGGFDAHSFVDSLKVRRNALNRQIEINELRFADNNAYHVDYIATKPMHCMMKKSHAIDVFDVESQFAAYLIENMKEGRVLDDTFMTFIEFDSIVPKFQDFDFMMLFVVDKPSKSTIEYPSIKGIHTYHKGSYLTIDKAYIALRAFAQKNRLRLKGTSIENYFRSSFTVKDEKDMLTDVILPLEDGSFD